MSETTRSKISFCTRTSFSLSTRPSAFVISLSTQAPELENVEGLCWTRPLDALRGSMEGTITDPRVMAAILFVVMVVLYTVLK